MELPYNQNITINQSAQFVFSFIWQQDSTPVNLTGYTVKSQIRTRPGSLLIFDLSEFVQLQPEGVAGRVLITVPATLTTNISKSGEWDLFVYPNNDQTSGIKLVGGNVTTNLAVTK